MKKLNLVLFLLVFGLAAFAGPAVKIKASKDCWQKGDTILLKACLYGFTDNYELQWQFLKKNNWHNIKDAVYPTYAIIELNRDQQFRVVVKEKGECSTKGQIFYSDTIYLTVCSALPIKVAYFKGFVKNDQAQLNFLVHGVRDIFVQISKDARNFIDLAHLTGDAGERLFTDKNIVGTSYYRLRLVGDNEEISYSDIILLRNEVNSSQAFILQVSNISGQILKTKSFPLGTSFQMDQLMRDEGKEFKGVLRFSFFQNGRLKETKSFSNQL